MALNLPAVSGSSGKLVVERAGTAPQTPWYPGQVFAREDLSYAEAMQQFVTDSQNARSDANPTATSPEAVTRATAKAEKQARRQAAEALKIERRQQRAARRQEDQA